ncbi:MAG TPA: hypothetical protein ENH21_05075 [Chromatiales bacterium]|nr:hypothetical protein [Chromatiales bacterium]HEX22784.1 hypothetical protein [Chromatiales bacterium]
MAECLRLEGRKLNSKRWHKIDTYPLGQWDLVNKMIEIATQDYLEEEFQLRLMPSDILIDCSEWIRRNNESY